MSQYGYIIIAAVVIVGITKLCSSLFNRRNRFVKANAKLPGSSYKLFYSDQRKGDRAEGVLYSKLLKSESYDLTGKPDFIYENKSGGLFPVELKSGEIGDKTEPYMGDLMQIAAYFILIEENFDISPAEGCIVYKDYMFTVKNTKRIRKQLMDILKDMRAMLKYGEGEPAANFVHCKYCVCKGTVCEYYED